MLLILIITYYLCNIANLATISLGCGSGWLSPALTILQSDDSPFESGRITVAETSWLGSITYIGSIFGVMFTLTMAKRYGRKIAICFFFLPLMVILYCYKKKEKKINK